MRRASSAKDSSRVSTRTVPAEVRRSDMGVRIEGRRIRGQEDKRGRSIEYRVWSIEYWGSDCHEVGLTTLGQPRLSEGAQPCPSKSYITQTGTGDRMIGWGHTLSGLGSRQSGTRYRSSGSGTGSGPEFYPVPLPVADHPNQRPEGRDLGPGNVSHVCTFAQAVGRFALLHLGQHAVLPLPSIHLCRDAVPTLPETAPQHPIRFPVSLCVETERPARAAHGAATT
jgi:hypothetical protein